MMRITPVVKQLLILNFIFYIGSQIPTTHAYQLFSEFYLENPNFKIWQPLTSMFMHAPMPNFTHILFNMFALYSFGSALEHFWGGTKFLFFYISCGLGAILLNEGIHYYQYHHALSLLQDINVSHQDIMTFLTEGKPTFKMLETIPQSDLVNMFQAYNSQTLGASGAIYGLLVAFAFMFPTAELGIMFIPIPIKAKYFVPGLLSLDLFLGFKGQSIFGAGGTGIAHFAHVGGAVTGFIMMWFWKKNQFNDRRWN
jgi:membrane associated rhomboid family serine protease